MEPQRIFEELMKADELQTHLGISKENVVKASYMEVSNSPMIEVIKDVINGVLIIKRRILYSKEY